MTQGLPLSLILIVGAAAFALLTSASYGSGLAVAGGFALCAGAVRRLEDLPRLGLLAVAVLVPFGYFGTQVTLNGFLNSTTKLVFIPAFAALLLERVVTGRPLVFGRPALHLALLGLALGVSHLLNERTAYSWWFLGRFGGMFLLFFLCMNALREERHVVALLAAMAVACSVSAVGSLFAPALAAPNSYLAEGGIARMTGWSTYDAPMFGADLLVSLLVCLYAALTSRRPRLRLLAAALAVALLLAIVRTYARGVSVVTAASVLLLLLGLRRRLSLPVVLLGAAVLALCVLPLVPPAYWERMATMVTQYETDPTMGRRAGTMRLGLEIFGQNPLLGWGPGNFATRYMAQEFRFENAGAPSVCFNLYLSVATQAGLIGLAAFGLLVWGVFRELRFVRRSYGAGESTLRQVAELLGIVLAALLLVSLFEPMDVQKYLWLVLGASAAVGHIRRAELAAADAARVEAACSTPS